MSEMFSFLAFPMSDRNSWISPCYPCSCQKFMWSILDRDPSTIQVLWKPFSSFCVILLTNQQNNQQTDTLAVFSMYLGQNIHFQTVSWKYTSQFKYWRPTSALIWCVVAVLCCLREIMTDILGGLDKLLGCLPPVRLCCGGGMIFPHGSYKFSV